MIPPIANIICDGAVSTAVFTSSGLRSVNSGYNIGINGEWFRLLDWDDDTSSTAYLLDATEQLLAGVLEVTVTGDGFGTQFVLRNLTDENLQISLTAWISTCDFQIAAANVNPTVVNTGGNNYRFCLSVD